jgi:type IV secretory pathway TrbL component
MLGSQSALAIHGQFEIQDGRIVALESPGPANAPAPAGSAPSALDSGAQVARAAQRWYRDIRAQSFGG